MGLHGKFVGRKGVLNRITRGFGLQADGAGFRRDQADGFISVLQQRFQLFLQGFEFVCLVVVSGSIPIVDQVRHSIVVGLIFKQIAGDIVGTAVIHGKLHLQSIQKFVLRGGGVGKFHLGYCGRGFAGHHGKLVAGFAVRALQHGAVLVSRHRDHAQMQRFALVFFQVDGQVGVRGTRPCFGGGFPDVAVFVLCLQLVVVQCAVGDARPCNFIRQGFGVSVVGQQDAVGRAGLGQAGANARILTGCRCAHGVGAARLGYAGNRKAHGGKMPIRRAVGKLIHRHGQRGLRADRFQGCRTLGLDFDLAVFGFAVQLVGVIGRTCGVSPSKGIVQIVLVIQRPVCRFAQGGGRYYRQVDIFGFGAGVSVRIPQRGKTVILIPYHFAFLYPHILHGVVVVILPGAEFPTAGGIAHTRVDGGCQNAQVGKIGQGGIGQIAEGHARGRAGQNRFDRLQGDISIADCMPLYRGKFFVLGLALQHNAVFGVDRLVGNFYVRRNGKVVGAGTCYRDMLNAQGTQTLVVIAGIIGAHIVLGGLHPCSRTNGFYRGAHGDGLVFDIREPAQVALNLPL